VVRHRISLQCELITIVTEASCLSQDGWRMLWEMYKRLRNSYGKLFLILEFEVFLKSCR
jgi:hypothetical protein